jgi:hypothetical protein
MNAIELLMRVEGLLDEKGHVVSPKSQAAIAHFSDANDKKLKELLTLAEEQKSE